jgi:hypothetical protein
MVRAQGVRLRRVRVLILKSGAADRQQMFHIIALVVMASIVLHSSTDVLVSRAFRRRVADA